MEHCREICAQVRLRLTLLPLFCSIGTYKSSFRTLLPGRGLRNCQASGRKQVRVYV